MAAEEGKEPEKIKPKSEREMLVQELGDLRVLGRNLTGNDPHNERPGVINRIKAIREQLEPKSRSEGGGLENQPSSDT